MKERWRFLYREEHKSVPFGLSHMLGVECYVFRCDNPSNGDVWTVRYIPVNKFWP